MIIYWIRKAKEAKTTEAEVEEDDKTHSRAEIII